MLRPLQERTLDSCVKHASSLPAFELRSRSRAVPACTSFQPAHRPPCGRARASGRHRRTPRRDAGGNHDEPVVHPSERRSPGCDSLWDVLGLLKTLEGAALRTDAFAQEAARNVPLTPKGTFGPAHLADAVVDRAEVVLPASTREGVLLASTPTVRDHAPPPCDVYGRPTPALRPPRRLWISARSRSPRRKSAPT